MFHALVTVGADKYIKIATVRNSTILPTVTEQIAMAEGEWKLLGMESNEYTLVRGNSEKSILLYTVGKCP